MITRIIRGEEIDSTCVRVLLTIERKNKCNNQSSKKKRKK